MYNLSQFYHGCCIHITVHCITEKQMVGSHLFWKKNVIIRHYNYKNT